VAETVPEVAGARPPAVALEGVTKTFGQVVALRGVSLTVADGEFVCFLGPSGCGKTTLLRIIAGLERQNAGAVRMLGRDVSSLPPSQRNYGIVFQSYALFPNLTAARNVAYGLEARRAARRDVSHRVDELLELVGLRTHRDRYPAQLSGGEQQRVALARALAPSPSLLLLDEPLSALDARVRQGLRTEIKQLQRRLGIATIMVTHDQEEALTMADRIVVMNHGVVEQIGAPAEIYTEPTSLFVARFVGQMNVLAATTESRPGWARVGAVALRCRPTISRAAGMPVTLGIRPEEIEIGSVRNVENRIVGRVSSVQFLGAFTRVAVTAADASLPLLQCDLSVSAFADAGIKEGMELPLALPPDRVRVFDRPT